jgi:hypothetical protein
MKPHQETVSLYAMYTLAWIFSLLALEKLDLTNAFAPVVFVMVMWLWWPFFSCGGGSSGKSQPSLGSSPSVVNSINVHLSLMSPKGRKLTSSDCCMRERLFILAIILICYTKNTPPFGRVR